MSEKSLGLGNHRDFSDTFLPCSEFFGIFRINLEFPRFENSHNLYRNLENFNKKI